MAKILKTNNVSGYQMGLNVRGTTTNVNEFIRKDIFCITDKFIPFQVIDVILFQDDQSDNYVNMDEEKEIVISFYENMYDRSEFNKYDRISVITSEQYYLIIESTKRLSEIFQQLKQSNEHLINQNKMLRENITEAFIMLKKDIDNNMIFLSNLPET